MVAVVFAVPGRLDAPTGGYAYDRRLIAELGKLGCHAEVLDLGDGFPHADRRTKAAAQARLAQVPAERPIVIDGLALGVLPEAAAALRASHCLIGLVHHPLALETGLSIDQADALRTSERAALASVRHVVVTSPSTARIVTHDYGVARDRVTVALPGTDRVAPPRRADDRAPALLAVGSLVPRKGYDVLMAALATLAPLQWHLTIVGDRERSPATAAALSSQISALHLARRVTLVGAIAPERLSRFYADADLFVLASRFEGYGMAFAEAIAHGLPVIGTTAGAIPETVPKEAGILVPPDDPDRLARALRGLLVDRAERERLARGARQAATRLPTWEDTARIVRQVISAQAAAAAATKGHAG